MRRIVLLLLPIWLPTLLIGQDLSGKWKGIFTPNNDLDGKVYHYELDIKELPNHTLSVITYTHYSNNFSAKATATGMHSPQTELVSVQETKFENMKLLGDFEACLMTNYLTYNTIRGRETLEGTYISNNSKLGKDCGSGTLYLEKEIPIVNFLAKKLPTQNKSMVADQSVAKEKKLNQVKITPNATSLLSATSSNSAAKATANSITNPPSINQAVAASNSITEPQSTSLIETNKVIGKADNSKTINRNQILPYVLVGRENKLVNKITVNNPHISFDMFDNGTIDNDSIMVYDNKVQILKNQRLSYKSIHFELDFSKEVTEHEIIIVAENLGTLPPNTALMILKDGLTRKEIYITSNLQTNAMLILNYIAPN
jgi:hypothetical protein